MIHIMYILLALLGLGLLVFIHELGHYFVARRQGMKIEVFSIGLGKPLFSWMHRGVKWQICPLLFGGYVRIAGMDKQGDKEPHEIPEGFYAKKPWARIKVAFAGPLANLLLALILFTFIWIGGGREKSFSDFTQLIGFVDPQSELYQRGVRPGDELLKYNCEPFEGKQDLIYAAIFNGRPATIAGNKIDYFDGAKTPYDYTLTPYQSPYLQSGMKSVGVLALARYLIYAQDPAAPFSPSHPMAKSGIEPGDRLLWVNGQLIFSHEQLSEVINDNRVLITFERAGTVRVAAVDRFRIGDLQLSQQEALEVSDWHYAASLEGKTSESFLIPYALNAHLVVTKSFPLLDPALSQKEEVLQPGDRVLAVGRQEVNTPADVMRAAQTRLVHIIVERGASHAPLSWQKEDRAFEADTPWDKLAPLVKSMGTKTPLTQNGPFHLLNPVVPVALKEFPFSPATQAELKEQIEKQRRAVEGIKDAALRERALEEWNQRQERLMLGLALRDRAVIYNPQPFALFSGVLREIFYTLTGLFSGHISPKLLVGPVGIVQVMQKSWGDGFKEALFWLGAVSLNLGILNLLPIPVLDGGHICFSLIEAVRKKPLTAKTMRRAMIPFIALLVFFFFYVTYHDLMRLFQRFF